MKGAVSVELYSHPGDAVLRPKAARFRQDTAFKFAVGVLRRQVAAGAFDPAGHRRELVDAFDLAALDTALRVEHDRPATTLQLGGSGSHRSGEYANCHYPD